MSKQDNTRLRVTDVLRAAGLRDGMRFKSDAERKWYFARGTAIHHATVLVDRGTLDWSTLDERIVPFVRAYEKFITTVRPVVLLTEHEVCGAGVVGHLDRVYKIGNAKYLC